ncbi:MAG: tetratricopeptide repeat protein [Magnetococcales bacterium]|nr:tetratricopeptide repeat protein [Magnetococcales bacterium]
MARKKSNLVANSTGKGCQAQAAADETLLPQLRQWYAAGKLEATVQAAEAALTGAVTDAPLLNLAAVCHIRLGDAEQAQRYWQQALVLRPDFAEAHNNLANLYLHQKRWEDAERSYRQALQARPDYVDALNNLGNLFKEQKKFAEAEACYRQALQRAPEGVPYEIYCNLGSLLAGQQRYAQAETCYRQGLRQHPQVLELLFGLAGVLRHLGQRQEAERLLRQLLSMDATRADVHNQLGMLCKEERRWSEADFHYRSALRLKPGEATFHNNLGTLLQAQKQFAEAESCYRQALHYSGDRVEIRNNLATLLQEVGRAAEAEGLYRQALQQDPDYAVTYCNLGSLLFEQKRAVEAEAIYRRALCLQPDYAEVLNNLGNLLKELRRTQEAEACYRQALTLQPSYRQAQWNLGLLLLSHGRYQEGWPCYEVRLQLDKAEWRQLEDLPFVRWQGESLQGKSILVAPEQGFGDQIQFCRYLPLLKERGAAWLTVLCSVLLRPLFACLPGVDQVLAFEQVTVYPRHDYWVSMLSLPAQFASTLPTIPNHLPYLQASAERINWWRPLLPRMGMRVGLFWRGRATPRDVTRSVPSLLLLTPLWSVAGVTFISLQKGEGEEEASRAPLGQPLLPLGGMIRDFADTAAIVSQLDLLITVDSAVAHVAGALGKPCWLMLSWWDSDWRWLLERTDSPWYPGVMRLFRQQQLDDWSSVIAEVAVQLAIAVKAWQKQTQEAKKDG